MEKVIILDESLLKFLLTQTVNKCVGKCLKRFDIEIEAAIKAGKDVMELKNVKKQVKELLYETFRDLGDEINNCSKSRNAIYLEHKDKGQ